MKALLNSDLTTISPINPQNFTQPKIQTSLHFSPKDNHHHHLIRWKSRFTAKFVIDSATIDQLGIPESDFRNPAVSTSYQSSKFRKPNQTVLEAQAKVCTGPTQTRPLTEEQAFKVLDTILRSGEDEEGEGIVLQSRYPWEGSDRDYDYEELLSRVFNILRENNPELAGDRRRTVMWPPQVLREGTKKTVFVNFMDLCKTF